MPLLELNNLACERDGRVLFSGLDAVIDKGDLVQIEGPNGCGKTTLLRAMTGLLPDYHGDILWRGEPIEKKRVEYLSELLFLGHLPGVKKTLSPRENLTFLSRLHQAVDVDAIDSSLAKVGLYGYEDTPGQQLSAGQLRRIALARLYLSQAPIWILDEPFTAIDKQGVANLESLFIEHASQGGCVILTTHQTPALPRLKRIDLQAYSPIAKREQVIDE